MRPTDQKRPQGWAVHRSRQSGTSLVIELRAVDRRHRKEPRTVQSVDKVPVRWLSRQQLDDRAPERPYVGFCRDGPELDDFRCCPVWHTGDPLVHVLDFTQVERNATVRKLHFPILGHENVRCLEVAVHDAVVVEVIETLEDLNHITRHQFLVA